MAYRTAELPPVALDEFASIPFFERMKMLQLHWVKYGFGTPKQTVMFYVWKIFYYALFGLVFTAAFTRGIEFNNIADWWHQPILYQKLMVWTILLEIVGLAATCGPLAFHFDPPIGGILYWWQNDTLRVPPYPNHVPFTKGNRRTPWDTGLYKLIVRRWAAQGIGRCDASMGAGDLLLPHPVDGSPRQGGVPVGPLRAVRADDVVLRAVPQLP